LKPATRASCSVAVVLRAVVAFQEYQVTMPLGPF